MVRNPMIGRRQDQVTASSTGLSVGASQLGRLSAESIAPRDRRHGFVDAVHRKWSWAGRLLGVAPQFSWRRWLCSLGSARPASLRRLRAGRRQHSAPAAMVSLLEPRVLLSAVTVNSTADDTTSDAVVTLREAVAILNDGDLSDGVDGLGGRTLSAEELAQINQTEPFGTNDTVRFAASTNGAAIVFGSVINVDRAMTIQGNGVGRTILDGQRESQIFRFAAAGSSSIDAMTLQNGYEINGGAVFLASGTLHAGECLFVGNKAGNDGGAIWSDPGTMLIVTDSTFTQNRAGFAGGGICALGNLTVANSTFSGNSAEANGGAIVTDYGVVLFTNTTITQNSANRGGGIGWGGGAVVNLVNSIIAGNMATGGSTDLDQFSGSVIASNCLIGTNAWSNTSLQETGTSAPDLNGNYIGGFTGGAIDPMLAPLADNGGPTPTHALLAGSLAINAGNNSFAIDPGNQNAPLENDQRGTGFARVFGGVVDMGAFEFGAGSQTIEYDFGDAPANYPVTLAEDGPRHVATGIMLGATRDSEADGTHSTGASADGTDEDGVALPAILFAHTSPVVSVTVTGGSGYLNAWADWNRDGDFNDPGEQVASNRAVAAGTHPVQLTLPETLTTGDVVMRFRLTSAAVATPLPTGVLPDGEVEDYVVSVLANASQPPVIRNFGTGVFWTEGQAPVVLSGVLASVSDADSRDFDGGVLTVHLSSNAQPGDVLGVRHQGTGVGQISVVGMTVFYRFNSSPPVAIGTLAGGSIGAPLTVTFNANANAAAVSAVMKNLTFASTSDDPTKAVRTVRVTVSDGDSSISAAVTKTITVTPLNDSSTINNFGGPVTFTEHDLPVVLDSDATIADPDSPNFDLGSLVVQITANGQSTDQLGLAQGLTMQGSVVTLTRTAAPNSFYVLVDGINIGRLSGGQNGSTLTVNFNANATLARATAVLQSLTFSNTSHTPSDKPRTICISFSDGDGGNVQNRLKTVHVVPVNDAPVIGGVTSPTTFNGTAVLPFQTATLTDFDTLVFTGSTLTIQLTNGATGDSLGIRNQGMGAGQINIANGTQIRSGYIVIGTFTGGANGAPLVITLNSSATTANVQALMRNIQFTTTNPGSLPRTLGMTLREADGTSGNMVNRSISGNAAI